MAESRDEGRVSEELEQLRRTRQARVDRMLDDEMIKQAPGNAAYWVAVVIGAFAVNVLVLLAIAR